MSDSNFQKVLVSGPVVNDDGTRSILVKYQTDDSTTTGLGLAVSFDSSSLSLTGSSLINSTDNIAAGNESSEGSTQTITFAWASLFGTWPGVTEADLFELTFAPVDGGGTNYDVEFATTSVAAGFTPILPGPTAILTSPLAVTVNQIDENSGEGQVIATVDGGPSGATYTLVDNTNYGDQPDQPDQAETVINVPAPAASTQQVYVSSSTTSEDGTQETVVISYNSDSAATTGLGLDIHFDSSKVSASDITALVGTDLLVNGSIKSDDSDLDGDANTDQIVSFGWASLFGNWPGSESADLAEITFDIAEGAEGSFDLNFTASSTAAGYTFVGQNQEIAIQTVVQPPLTINSATGDVTLNVNPDFESVEDYDFIVVANAGAEDEESAPGLVAIGNVDEVAPTVTSSDSAPAVNENVSSVVIYTATADDSADHSDGVLFSLGADSDSALSIDENTGEVSLDVSVDFESQEQITFSVIATDLADNASSEQSVTVDVTNLDEVAPTITSGSSAGSIDENSGAGQVIYTATADDSMDVSDGVTFSLSDDAMGAVSIDASTGEVTLIGDPDYENDYMVSFSVVATDAAGNSNFPEYVTLDINNLDDSAPIFMDGSEVSLTDGNGGIEETHSNDESSYMSQVVYTAYADEDSSDVMSGMIYFSISDDHGGIFSIDSSTGDVSLNVAPDYEDDNLALNEDADGKFFSFTVTVEDFDGNSADQSVKLYVSDVAELPPVFLDDSSMEISSAALDIDENNDSTVVIYSASAVPNPIVVADTGDDSVVYSLADEMSSDFYIDSLTGSVSLEISADFEMQSSYSFTVVATDTLGNVNQLPVTLTVNDLDEVAPTITSDTVASSIDENDEAQVIYTATADDSADISGGFTFSLGEGSDPALSIDSISGEVSINVSADHESQSVYSFSVIATDAAGNESAEQFVSMDINDLDDAAPAVTSGDTASAIDENSGAGQVIYTVAADDSEDDVADTPITYSLAEGSDAGLSIDSATGAVSLTADPDHEAQSQYSFAVIATDAAGNASDAQSVTLDINDLDDTAPTISSATVAVAITENSGAGQVVYTAVANDDADVNDGTLVYSLSDDSNGLFAIDASSGEVTLSEDPDFENAESYSFTVVATDGSNNASSQEVSLSVTNVDDTAPIVDVPEVPPTLASFSSENQTVYEANGVDDDSDITSEPLSYAISLPADLEVMVGPEETMSIDQALVIDASTGVVTYLPVPQTNEVLLEIPYSVTATDGAGNETTVDLQLNISGKEFNAPLFDAPEGFEVAETSQVIQNEDTEYEELVEVASSVTGSLDASVQSGDVIYIANVADATPMTFEIKDAASVDENSGDNQVVYTAVSTGHLSIDVNSGEVTISGTPWVAGSDEYNFTVIATDSSGNQSEQAVSLSVADYTGGSNTSSATFALAEGHDDALVIDSQTGEVTLLDNPDYEASSDYSFVVEVSDDNGVREQAVTVSVGNYDDTAPEITSGDDAGSITENSAAGQVVYTASSDDSSDVSEGSVSFSLTANSDSALSIDADTGVVTLADSPNHEAQSEYVFTVVAEDSAGNASQETVTLTVNDLDEIAPTVTSASSVSVDETGSAGEFIYAASSHDSQSVIEQGAISQQFVRNEDGTLTVRLFVDSSVAQNYSAGLEAVNFTLGYSSEEQGVLAIESIDFPSDPLSAIPNVQGDEISFAMYFTTPEFAAVSTDGYEANLYNVSGDTPIAEVTFSVGNDSVVNQFTVSDAGLTEYNGGTSFPGGQSISEYQMSDTESSVVYSLSNASDEDLEIDSATGIVVLNSKLDHESVDQYSFTVVATDSEGNSSSQNVTVSVNDLDEVAPVVTSGAIGASIDENSGAGQVIYTATASDNADASNGVSFSLAAGSDSALTIDASTGEVTLADSPDHEAQDEYSFTVIATDAAGHSSDLAVTVAVNDLDEAAPTISSSDNAGSIDENEVAQIVYTATAEDAGDVTNGFTWSLSGVDQDVFAINAATGDVTMLASPDYESQSEYSFTVVATDAAGNASEQAVSLSVNNLDEVAAVITSADTAQAIAENSGAGQVVYAATADDSADVSNGVTFSLSDDSDSALSIDSSTGAVSLSDNPDFEAESAYNFTVVATDAAGNEASKSVSLSITNLDESAPTITSGDSVSIAENTGVNQVIYTATSTDNDDVSGGVTYSLAEGSDVALSIDADSGAVTLAKNPNYEMQNAFNFTVVATDAAGNASDSQQVTVSIADEMVYTFTHWSSDVVLDATMVDGSPHKELSAAEVTQSITAGDALDALKLSVGLSVGSYQDSDHDALTFQNLSADIDSSGNVSSSDARKILVRSARIDGDDSFVPEWRFEEMHQDADSAAYAGYVLGDVDGSWASAHETPVINLQESAVEGQIIYNYDAGANTISAKDDSLSVDLATGVVSLSADADYETQSSYSFTMVNNYSGNVQNFTVSIVNEDEVAPEIVSSATVSLAENSGAGQVVYVAAADDSADISGGVTYTLDAGSDTALSIDSETGDVTLSDNPDYSVAAEYNFTVIATDAAGHYDVQAVTINVEPTPDSVAPEFNSGDAAAAIDENSGAAQVIYTASATDENDVTYSLSGDAAGLTIDPVSGKVSLTANPDHEAQSDYSFTVVATDEAGNSSEQAVSLTINNLDDTAPTITSGSADNDLDENGGSVVIYAATADDSADVSDGVTFSLAEGHDEALSINPETGMVIFTGPADHEAQSSYSYTVVATDAAGNSSEQTLTLNVNDLDDASPTITSGGDAGSIDENSGAGQVIYTATADDSADISGGVSFSLSDASEALTINANTGRVTLSDNPDFETASSYNFVVVATDAAGNASQQSVSLSINDMDEIAPSITSDVAISIEENSGAGQAVYTATATDDADISAGVSFSLAEGSDSALSIDTDTGVVTLANDPDQESQSEYNFTVVASDGVNQSTQAVTLTVGDLDEAAPEITSGDAVQIDENSGAGQVVYTATADDSADVSDGVTYSLAAGSDAALSIDATSGEVTLSIDPDADTQDTYSFAVVASDAVGNASDAQSVTLSINNLDEAAPTITSGEQAASIDENSGSQIVYVATSTDTDDVSAGETTYSLAEGSDAALAINASTGEVLLTTSPDHESQSEYSFTVVATDAAGNESASQSVTLSVNDLDEVAATVTSSDSADAIDENSGAGQVVYNATADDSADISGGFTFSLAAGSDDALSIDAQTGAVTLSDDPNFEAEEEYSFTVVVTDAAGNVSEGQSVSLSVNNLDEVAATITSSGSAGSVDENSGANKVIYTAVANDSSDTSDGVTFSLASGSDQALSIDGATGEVTLASDTDFEAQSSYSFIVIATDAAGNTSVGKSVTLTVNNLDEEDPAITSGDSATNLNENSGAGQWVYTATADDSADISGGVTFSLADETLGFSIDPETGVVTTNADFSADAEFSTEQGFTVVATDAADNASEQAVTLTINNIDEIAPEVTSGDAADAIDENSGSGQVIYTASASDDADVSGGYSFSLSSDSDSALSINSATGAVTLSSNPDYEAKSQYSFTVIATDAAGNESAGQSVTLDINNLDEVAPAITSGDSAGTIAENSGAGQVIYTATSDDSGDASDSVTYSLSEHSDSALSIDANTGAVTLADDPNFEAQSAYSFIVVATDAAGNSSSELVSLNVSNVDEAAPTVTSGDTASSVDENSGEGQLVYTATADDSADVSGGVSFSLADSDAGFSIDSETGAVTTNADFVADYEDASEQSFTVIATDAAGYSSEQTVTVAVNNLDESSPEVTSADSASAIDENSGAGQVIYTATATDGADLSDGFSFSLAAGSDSAVSIDAETGEVTLADNPNFEGQAEYSFTVVATDAAGNPSAGQTVTVAINNLDEVAPTITLDGVTSDLDENSGANQVLATISADDSADTSGGITYSLSADSDPALSINNETGEVILSDNPDFEVKSEYSMTVVATDAAGNISDAQTISLVVNNVDESAPTITSTDTVIVVEGTGAGQVVYQAAADDSGDVSDGVSYSFAGDSVSLTSSGSNELDPGTQVVSVSDVTKSGDQLSVAVEYNADDADLTGLGLRIHFDSSEVSLSDISDVLSQDHVFTDAEVQSDTDDLDGNASTNSFVHVAWASVDGDWTGEVPTDLLTVNFTVADTATGSASIGFSASDNAIGYDFVGNAAAIDFDPSAMSPDLSIDSGTGAVTLAVDPDHAAQSAYDFTVVATDAAGLSDEQQVSLNIAEKVAGASASAVEAGAIEQRFVQNSDGSMTLQLFVADAVAADYANGIENLDLVLEYSSSQVGSIVADQISAPANPFISLANDTVPGEVTVAQIYFPTPYSVDSGAPIMEVDFNLLDGVSSATFGVSGVILGMDDVADSTYDVSVTTYAGSDDADVFALVDGVADVNSGAGSDIFVVTEDTDANILVDFESGVDTLELGLLLDSAGYTGLSANSDAADQSAHQVNGNIPNLADLISDNDGSLDNAFGGYVDDSTNVLTIFTDVDSSAGSVDMQSIEVTLGENSTVEGENSTVEDDDLSVTFSAFIA